MSELVEFIRGRLDADEEWVRIGENYLAEYQRGIDAHPGASFALTPMHGDMESPFSPARVLAEVNAKRAIVDMLADAEAVIARIGPDLDKPGDAAEWANYHAWRQAVEALAQPYAGEPGWRDEWGTQ